MDKIPVHDTHEDALRQALRNSGILNKLELDRTTIGDPLTIRLDDTQWTLYDLDRDKILEMFVPVKWPIVYNLYRPLMDREKHLLDRQDKMVIWLQRNVSRDRWLYDSGLHHIPKRHKNAFAVHKLHKLVEQCDYDFVEYQKQQHDNDHARKTLSAGQPAHDRAQALDQLNNIKHTLTQEHKLCRDFRQQCITRQCSPMYAHMYIGHPTGRGQRKKVKVMFDSGCSLVVASKRFIDDLNGSVLHDDKLELRTPPYLPGATSAYGQRQDSCGIVPQYTMHKQKETLQA